MTAPATHLLVAGVSLYPHLDGGDRAYGIRSLSAAALTAYRVAKHFNEKTRFAAPLESTRLMVSPTEPELAEEPALAGFPPATLDHFLHELTAWREDLSTHRDNIGILYLVGNGLERRHADQVFLFEDFGDGIGPIFRKAVTLSSIVNGLAPTDARPGMARTQLYVFDASRVPLPDTDAPAWSNATAAFDLEAPLRDDRTTVTLFASAARQPAYSRRGKGTLFSEALLRCLDGGAATPIEDDPGLSWGVTVGSLVRALTAETERLSEEFNRVVSFDYGGAIGDAPLTLLANAPQVELEIAVQPEEALPSAHVALMNEDGIPVLVREPPIEAPINLRVPAGFYRLAVETAVGSRERVRQVLPPAYHWSVDVGNRR